MPVRLLSVFVAALLALVLSACGGNSEDPNTVLEETFSGEKEITSGRLQLDVSADVKGTGRLQGPVSLKLNGPFQKADGDGLPQFDFDATVAGSGMTHEGGASSTGDKGYALFGGQNYVLADPTFEQFKRSYERAQREHEGESAADQLTALGIDPRKWIRNPLNDGEADVGDVETIKITGDVDVPRLLDDLSELGAKGKAQGKRKAHGKDHRLTEERKRELAQAIKSARVEVYTGKDDRILRRIFLDADIIAPPGSEQFDSADVKFDYSVLDVNEDQKITAPSDVKPFSELAAQLRGLGLGVGRPESRNSPDR